MAKHSTHSLAHTLHKMIVKAGAHVIEGQDVTKILVEEGRAVGVQIRDGREFRARRFVASGVNPKVAQSIMRHSDVNLTMSRNTHVYAGQEVAAAPAAGRTSGQTPLPPLVVILSWRSAWRCKALFLAPRRTTTHRKAREAAT